jgi:hypothetical protein
MRRSHALFLLGLFFIGCEADSSDTPDAISFRASPTLDVGPPAPDAPVVATLTPGAPFEIGNRYVFAKAPGVGPDMSRFAPQHVGDIPHLSSGDVVAVVRNGKVSRARIVGLGEEGGVVFRSQLQSPFTHAFQIIPWSAWGASASTVAGCSADIGEEWLECAQTVGEGSWCSDAADEELDECASGQDASFGPAFGGKLHFDFECLLPYPHVMTVLGGDMTMGAEPFDCAGSFWGTVTQEPGFFGCENVYNGTWVADDPDCVAGPSDGVILHDISG